ncbi:hypothetical protein ACQ4PT_034057 [Festuca glaucescens]
MDKQGPAVKHIPIKFSSCRGVAFEIKPSQVNPFALDAAGAAEQPPNDSNGGRWVWFPQPMNREHSSATLRSALSRGTSSHFCDLDDSDNDANDDESVAADEIQDNEEMALVTAAADVSNVRSRSRRSLSSSAKPVRAEAAKGHSRLGVILLDQGMFTLYKRLFMLCVAVNAAGLAAAATDHFPYAKGHAALFAMGNILALTLCRSEASLGGIHSGCGVSSLAWLVYALVRALEDSHMTPREIVGMSSAILALLALSCLAAFPLVRHLHHNVFERTHRFAGWTALALLWVFVVLSAGYDLTTSSYSGLTVTSLVKRQELWLMAIITFLTILPWFAVQRVPVMVTAPSTNALIITFQGGVKAGLLGRISRSLLSEWHAFGIISGDGDTHSMLAGAVGDFTRGLVSDLPSHLWVHKVQFAGLPYLISMYRRVTMVTTGSGICVFLSFLMQPSSVEVSLVWVAKGIDANYGEGMSATMANIKILAGRVIVHDTATMGRPNVSELAVSVARRWNADAVIVTRNPEGSRDIISGCKKAGIPTFGPIWDS